MYSRSTTLNDATLAIFDATLASQPGLSVLVMATNHGEVVAHRSGQTIDPQAVSSCAYAVLAICDTLAAEIGIGRVEYASFQGTHGNLVALRGGADGALTIVAGSRCDADIDTSSLLLAARDSFTQIGNL